MAKCPLFRPGQYVALVLAICLPAPAAAQASSTVVRADPATVLRLAQDAEQVGNRQAARAYYQALSADLSPTIREAAAIALARMDLADGDKQSAGIVIRRELDRQPKSLRLRLMLASVLVQTGEVESARHQLRSALALPLPPGLASRIGRYSDQLQTQQPISANLSVAVAPDSNINSATSADKIGTVIGDFQLTDDSKARSGFGLALGGDVVRRFDLRKVQLSLGARGMASLYRDHQFDEAIGEVFVRTDRQAGPLSVSLEINARGQWRGYHALVRQSGIAVRTGLRMGKRTAANLWLDAGLAQVVPNARQSGHYLSVDGSLERSLTPTLAMAIGPTISRYKAREPAYSMTSWGVHVDAVLDIGRATLSLGLAQRWAKADDRLALLPEARRERATDLQLGLNLRTFTFGGMAPFARLTVTNNRSNVAIYDYRRRRLEFGLSRAF